MILHLYNFKQNTNTLYYIEILLYNVIHDTSILIQKVFCYTIVNKMEIQLII